MILVDSKTDMVTGNGQFTFCSHTTQSLAALQCSGHKETFSDMSNGGEDLFQLVADTRQVGVHGLGANVMAHVDGKVAESVFSRFNWEFV